MYSKCYSGIKVNVLSAQAISEFLISTVSVTSSETEIWICSSCYVFVKLKLCAVHIPDWSVSCVDFRLIQETVQHLLDVSKGVFAQVVGLPGLPAPTMLQLVDLFICNRLLRQRQPASKGLVHKKGYIPERCDALHLLLWGPQCPHGQCHPPRPPAPGHRPQIVPPVHHMLP